ncbi:MAG: cytochrome [Hydrocarboniphaga sp.]|uniref:c-type cytochrome n=1 Tax=Hydrocarboniphaga sp. TaxID=2033016 RepID=UPI00261209A3|nr:c-type cytochrome [Hydrocarboniphaga sp.]MDB5970470.1 cytochrome [Hydrocarboniphaga sp.]
MKSIALLATVAGLAIATSAHADEQLMSQAGCIACHRIDQKLVGPAFKDIAAKYKTRSDAASYLFDKVRNGSEDIWGDIPMPAKSPEHLSDEQLKAVIDWLLTL